ncbi:MAG TPA: 50S ribosomal protein L29 [Thermoplasmata archaeon]|nr:50S ribosomal protein L29 [Thermoplasmata archaeon]
MTLLRTKEIRAMRVDDRRAKLKELNDELMHERGVAAMGGAPASPGKIRALRKNIARIMTIDRELELAEKKPAKVPSDKGEKKSPRTTRSRPPVEEALKEETDSRVGHDKEEKK